MASPYSGATAWLGVETRRGNDYYRVAYRDRTTAQNARDQKIRHVYLGPVRRYPHGFADVFLALLRPVVLAGHTPNKALLGDITAQALQLLSAKQAYQEQQTLANSENFQSRLQSALGALHGKYGAAVRGQDMFSLSLSA